MAKNQNIEIGFARGTLISCLLRPFDKPQRRQFAERRKIIHHDHADFFSGGNSAAFGRIGQSWAAQRVKAILPPLVLLLR